MNSLEQEETERRHASLFINSKTLKLENIKMLKFKRSLKPQRNNSRRPRIENNNNDVQKGKKQAYDNPSAQNRLNTYEEQRLQSADSSENRLQALAELLGVTPGEDTSEDGSRCSVRPAQNQNLSQTLIQRSVSQRFPKPPADLHQNLQRHLVDVQVTVLNELVKLGPVLQTMDLMGCLIACYHRQTFDHLSYLLLNVCSSQNCLVLMKWVLHTYLSQELLGHPDFKETDPIKKIDLLLYTEWSARAKDKLLENVQKEVRESLEKILQNERRQEGCHDDEVYVQFYVDTIQCTDAMPKEAEKISTKLFNDVQEVCFQELQTFMERYATEQTEILNKKAKTDKPETTQFLKTLNICKQLKQHVQTKGRGMTGSVETVETLEKLKASTLKLLMEIVADIAERSLKNYFKRENKEFYLIQEVETCFLKLSWFQDVQKEVMDKVYKVIVHLYFKHLVQTSQTKLKKCWSPDVGQTITEDAEFLHKTISVLAPDVQQWNRLLLKIPELLDCKSTDTVKLMVASMQKDCPTWSEDLDLLPALLRWKGLSQWQVREVLNAIPGGETILRSVVLDMRSFLLVKAEDKQRRGTS